MIGNLLGGVLLARSSVLYTGPIARNYLGGADISYFLSMAVTALLYLIIIKTKNAVKKETVTTQTPVGAAGME